jgi:glycosyltransferase involved in cell wall biosynthesis
VSGLACVALDLAHASRLAVPTTRARVSQLLADMQACAPRTSFPRLEPRPSVAMRVQTAASGLARRALPTAARVLPPRGISRAEELALAAAYRPSRSALPTRLDADVVFCPAVGPSIHDPGVPLVCGIDSLAFLSYPESFDVEEAFVRGYLVRRALRLAAGVVCPSEFVRDEVIALGPVEPERVVVIRPGVPRSASSLQPGLTQDEFLLCPAPFVGYQNHRVLLMAYALYRAQHPESRLKLVCVGSPGPELPLLEHSVNQMHLDGCVSLSVDTVRLGALVQTCRGVILPTLYEASGWAALMARSAGVPVLSSGAGALREVVGDAGACFDPRLPESVVQAIELADSAPEGYRALARRGRARAAQLGGPGCEAEQYLRLLGEVA